MNQKKDKLELSKVMDQLFSLDSFLGKFSEREDIENLVTKVIRANDNLKGALHNLSMKL